MGSPESVAPRTDLRFWFPVLFVISLGGGLGSSARYGFSMLLPAEPGEFPWATLLVNVLGCLFMGIVMVLITEVWSTHRLLRPFLGVGVLGGFTTFSTYAVEVHQQLMAGNAAVAFGYLVGTVLGALLGVLTGVRCARRAVDALRAGRRGQS